MKSVPASADNTKENTPTESIEPPKATIDVSPSHVEKVDKNTDTMLDYENPLIAQFMRENSLDETKTQEKSTTVENKKSFVENRASSLRKQTSSHVRHQESSSHSKTISGKAASLSKPAKSAEVKKHNTTPKKNYAQPADTAPSR